MKLCAMMSADLARWSSSLSSRLGGSVARNRDHREEWEAIVRAGEDALVLDALQQDTPVLLAFCRAWSEAARERWAAESAADPTPEQTERFL